MRGAVTWMAAMGLWLGLGFSVGWYYTVTYYGRTGLPVPTPEVCASLILYYFSVLNVDTEIQALHWMLTFPICGALWVALLVVFARRFGASPPPASQVACRFALASLPLVLPGPWMAWIAGHTATGFEWERMLAVALRRGGVSPWSGLNTTYVALGVAVVVVEFFAYRSLFPLRGRRAWLHALTAAAALVIAVSLLGAVAAWPLRAMLE